jgi:hypothetical protein
VPDKYPTAQLLLLSIHYNPAKKYSDKIIHNPEAGQ